LASFSFPSAPDEDLPGRLLLLEEPPGAVRKLAIGRVVHGLATTYPARHRGMTVAEMRGKCVMRRARPDDPKVGHTGQLLHDPLEVRIACRVVALVATAVVVSIVMMMGRVHDAGVEVRVLAVKRHDTSLVAIDPNRSEER
jgi:hypothetical protein